MTRGAGCAALVLAVALTGCNDDSQRQADNGVTDMRPAEVLEAADDAMASVHDVTYEGSASGGGMTMKTVDVYVMGEAFLHTQRSPRWGGWKRLCVGDYSWGRKDERWLRAVVKLGPDLAKLYASGWWPAGRGMVDCRGTDLVPDGDLRRSFVGERVVTIDGQRALRLRGEDELGNELVLWIAAQGEPLVLRASGSTALGAHWARSLTKVDTGATLSKPADEDIYRPNR